MSHPKHNPQPGSRQRGPKATGTQMGGGDDVLLEVTETKTAQALHQYANIATHTELNQERVQALLADSHKFDVGLKEIEIARQFNVALPSQLPEAIETLLQAVRKVTGCEQVLILGFDEDTGVYTCLNDEGLAAPSGVVAREITKISDHFLQGLLPEEPAVKSSKAKHSATKPSLLHTYLFERDGHVGIVALAHKVDVHGKPLAFDIRDEITLDLVGRYLAPKVLDYQEKKRLTRLPEIQGQLLNIAEHLVSAIDTYDVFQNLFTAFHKEYGFEICQYVEVLNQPVGEGLILFESLQLPAIKDTAPVNSFIQPNRRLPEFGALASLVTSTAWKTPYYSLKGPNLGSKDLKDCFDIANLPWNVAVANLMPVFDTVTQKLRGVIVCIQLDDGQPETHLQLSDASDVVIKQAIDIVTSALSRTIILEKAMALATSDELTGLYNRRGFYERFEIEIERARRNPTQLCAIMIDVDFFKRINDTYGHLFGDFVLQQLSRMFLKNIRKSDVVCRFGGEEFAMLLPDTSLKAGADLLERIRIMVSEMPLETPKGDIIHITISAGVAMVNVTDHLSRTAKHVISETLALSDEQLYRAKTTGRNQVCVHQ